MALTLRRGSRTLILGLLALATSLLPPLTARASAPDRASIPRLLPNIPAGYVSQGGSIFDWSIPATYVHYLGTASKLRYINVAAYPRTKEQAMEYIEKGERNETVKVRGTTGVVKVDVEEPTDLTLAWFEQGRLMSVNGVNGVSRKVLQQVARSIVLDEGDKAAFSLRGRPAGYRTGWAGPISKMIPLDLTFEWVNDEGDRIVYRVRRVVAQFQEIDHRWGRPAPQTTKVNGAVANLYGDVQPLIAWSDQDLLLDIYSSALTQAELIALAESVAPVDETTWQAAFDPP
jgi:hypothetical protein